MASLLRYTRLLAAEYARNSFKCNVRLLSSQAAVQPFISDDIVEYPEVKTRRPAGNWGDMSDRMSWLWFDEMQKVGKMETVQERIDHLTQTEFRTWRFPALQLVPRTFEYQQYITKTRVQHGLPTIYEDIIVEEELKLLKPLIQDIILIQNEFIDNEKTLKKVVAWKIAASFTHSFLKQLLEIIMISVAHKQIHLLHSQVDENVLVQSFWDRYGIQRFMRKESDENPKYEYQNNSRFQAEHVADFQVRLENPLPEFIPREDAIVKKGDYPAFPYYPGVVGQSSERFKSSCVPGFCYGDDREFGLLSALSTNNSQMWRFEKMYGKEHANQNKLGMGMAASFSWLVAQAHYQGFNTLLDLTYPLTTQTILTDGQNFTFLAYQLNTLHLWKNDEGNALCNVCWISEEQKLYESIEDGKLHGFNDDVLKQLIKYFLIQPGHEGVDLKPTLPKTALPEEYICRRPVVVIKEEEIKYDATR